MNLRKTIILLAIILSSNFATSQNLEIGTSLQGKWNNKDYEIEIKENLLNLTFKKNETFKNRILTFVGIPKTNDQNEFECWSTSGKFIGNVVKDLNIAVKDELYEYIYIRLKVKNNKLVFDFSISFYSKITGENETTVPENVLKEYSVRGYLKNKLKFAKE